MGESIIGCFILWLSFRFLRVSLCLKHSLGVTRMLGCHISRVVRKPAFCICENKDADQLRGNFCFVVAIFDLVHIVATIFHLP